MEIVAHRGSQSSQRLAEGSLLDGLEVRLEEGPEVLSQKFEPITAHSPALVPPIGVTLGIMKTNHRRAHVTILMPLPIASREWSSHELAASRLPIEQPNDQLAGFSASLRLVRRRILRAFFLFGLLTCALGCLIVSLQLARKARQH